MDPNSRKILFKNHTFLVEHLIFYEIQDHLFQNRVLSAEEVEYITIKEITQAAKIRRLLRIIDAKQNPNVFPLFCKSLRESEGYDWVANILENTDISGLDDPDGNVLVPDNDDKLQALVEQMFAEIKEIKKVMQSLQNKSLARVRLSSEPREDLGRVTAPGLDEVDKPMLSRFVHKILAEFERKPRKYFSKIERISCSLSFGTTLSILSPSALKIRLSATTQRKEDLATIRSLETMNRMTRRVLDTHGNLLQDCVNSLDLQEMNGYRAMDALANEMFKDDMEVNWGRIISWFAFWGSFVKKFPLENVEKPEEFVRFYGEFFGFYLAKRLHLWIAGAGGWEAFVEKYKEKPTLGKHLQTALPAVKFLIDGLLSPP